MSSISAKAVRMSAVEKALPLASVEDDLLSAREHPCSFRQIGGSAFRDHHGTVSVRMDEVARRDRHADDRNLAGEKRRYLHGRGTA